VRRKFTQIRWQGPSDRLPGGLYAEQLRFKRSDSAVGCRLTCPLLPNANLRRSPRCSMTTQRARMQQRPSSATASVSACAASCIVAQLQVRASRREEKTASPIPAESHVAVCMPAASKEAI
jgi:hypothetical protein